MQQITPMLWFDNQAEEAMNFYLSIFEDGEAIHVSRYPEGAPGQAGSAMVAQFRLGSQQFLALNAGPIFKFTEAVSFVIHCETQAEVDHYWYALLEGGEESQCGWLKDKFGLSWQVTPTVLAELMSDPDPERASRTMQAMLQMKKLDIQTLRDAADATVPN